MDEVPAGAVDVSLAALEHSVAPAFVPEVFGSTALTWVLVGIAAYWLTVNALKRRDLLPGAFGAHGPLLTIRTTRGRDFLDWAAGPRRFWRAWANFGVGIALVVMASMFAFLLMAAIAALQAPDPTEIQQPRNVLVIPGVNEFLPLSAAPEIVFGLLVGLVVHEGGHGLLCRVEDIDIESMGVALFALIPIGAFVEPDEMSRQRTSRGGQTRMFAAGVTNNFFVAIVAFALLFGPVAGAVAVAPGAAVGAAAPGSPAAEAGIDANDRITAIDGEAIADNDEFEEYIANSDDERVAVEVNDEDTVTVNRSLLVTATVEGGPTPFTVGDRIVAVGDDSVGTVGEFRSAVGEEPIHELTVEREVDGETVTVEEGVPVGAFVHVADDGPLADADAEAGETLVITAVDDERVLTASDLQGQLRSLDPGDEIAIEGYGTDREQDGDYEAKSYNVTIGEHPQTGDAFLGVNLAPGFSGIALDDFGVELYPAEEFLVAIGGEGEAGGMIGALSDSFLGKIVVALFLPIMAIMDGFTFNFAGFTGGIQNFYQAGGAMAVLGDWSVFLVANLLFWSAWINLQLGFFNCIPAFPLDGGHILRTSTEAVISRLPIEATRGMVRTVTTGVGLTMLVSFLLMIFGPSLLSG